MVISKLTNLFKKEDLDEQLAFQTRVAKLLAEFYPDRTISVPADRLTIEIDGSPCGLTNIHSSFLLTTKTDSDLRAVVSEHFGVLFRDSQILVDSITTWEVAATRLMPQLMPMEFLEKLPLLSFPFGEEVVLGFVLDSEQSYSYVTQEKVSCWKATGEEIRRIATENLGQRSRGIEVNTFPGDDGFVVICTMDGFDAVRIISPKIQEFVAEVIGAPFYFGIPNRDFLICWSDTCSEDAANRFAAQVRADSAEQPYPLSARTFQLQADGTIREHAPALPHDPRADSANLN